jgi:hypothetical protein
LGIPIVSTLNTSSFVVVGSTRPDLEDVCCSTFTLNINGFLKSVTYCGCVIGGTAADNADWVMSSLVSALNSDATSPVTAAITGVGSVAVVTLTSKIPGTVLTVTSTDDGATFGELAGISFLQVPIVPALNTASLDIVGSLGANMTSCCATFTVNVNGFAKSGLYGNSTTVANTARGIEESIWVTK